MKRIIILAALAASFTLALAGCGNDEKPQASQAQQHAASEQAEIAKYNAYVDAANRSEDFSAVLDEHLKLYAQALA